MIAFTLKDIPSELRDGIAAVVADHKRRFRKTRDAIPLRFMPDASLASETHACGSSNGGITVRYSSRSAAFRAMGCLLAHSRKELKSLNFTETSSFSMRGLMIDCSRNGVFAPEAARQFMRRAALMGVNMLMFYTEDTYEVPGEPFFGYLRGGFTQDEMKALDDYAHALGIELIPCIQTLGHMEQALQWDPYFYLRDTPNILLSGHEPTYDFIRKMIVAASAPVRSRRIHIGMDEAHGLGSGKFKERFGEKPPFEIMNAHLSRVRDICREQGLNPMIWSDMYFRLGSKTGSYYDPDWSIPEHIVKGIPKDVQLVYWDYSAREIAHFRKFIGFHRKLGSDPVMAGGIGTWLHLWCVLPVSFAKIDSCMGACRVEKLNEVIMTMWGDDGMDVDIFSALPGIQYFCEHAFGASNPKESAQRHFEAVCGAAFAPWVRASDIDLVPYVARPERSGTNAGRSLLWQDPLFPVLEPMLRKVNLAPHYNKLAAELERAAKEPGLARRLKYPLHIARVLAIKSNLRFDLEKAYRSRNRKALSKIMKTTIPLLRREMAVLWKVHRAMWMQTYKPFGWEVIECRYGGLMARMATLADRLRDFLAGRMQSIPELDAELHNSWPDATTDVPPLTYCRVKTPSCIK